MPIEAFAAQNCSIARTMSVIGERWTVLVLRELFLGRRRFDEMQAELGVATNILSRRLSTLVDEGIARRHRYSEHPERFEYRLTDKGRELMPVLMAVQAWGDRHTAGRAGPPLEMVHADCGQVFHAKPTCDQCGKPIEPGSVRPRLGPGASREQRERARRREEKRRRAAA
jgi:DNA-binding HxlR family transcriptional regulator